MASIIFEGFGGETPPPTLTGGGTLALSGFGYADPFAITALGFGNLLLTASLEGEGPGVPLVGDGMGELHLLAMWSFGGATMPLGTGSSFLMLYGYGYDDAAMDYGFGAGNLVLTGFGAVDDGPVFLDDSISVQESFSLAMIGETAQTWMLRAILSLEASRTTERSSKAEVDEIVQFGDRLVLVYATLVEESLDLGTEATVTLTGMVAAIDRLLLTGVATSYAEAVTLIVDAIVFATVCDQFDLATVTEQLELVDAVAAAHTSVSTIIEALVLEAFSASGQSVLAVVRESLDLSEDMAGGLTAGQIVRESIAFRLIIRINDESYVAWVMHGATRGLTKYTNYPFNSFCRIGGNYYGADDTGIHRLDGADDNGEDINARIRLGLNDFGERKIKNVPTAYFGYTTDGDLRVKVVVIDPTTGEKSAAIYRLADPGAANVREHRVKFGRGLKSVDWDVVLENVDGADFELHSVEFHPLNLDRRTRS